MRFEELESRIVFAQTLGPAVALNLVSMAPVNSAVALPAGIQFRDTSEDFEYASAQLSPEAVSEFFASTQQWAQDPGPVGIHYMDEVNSWRKAPNHYPPEITPPGIMVARRFASNTNAHTMVQFRRAGSDCYHTGGMYTEPDYHYVFSFDVRHPETELSWLTESHWGLVMQLWGPREPGETPRTPPFSIYSRSVDGQPTWRISSVGDSRRTTQSGDFEEKHSVQIPMGTIGDWHRFDVEFVPNAFGEGLIRTWFNGELVAEWKSIKNAYNSVLSGHPSGPLNPLFGLYSSLPEDDMEAHLDNISIRCSGSFQSSIAGTISGGAEDEGHVVYATNQSTGESFGTYTERFGLYVLNVPEGIYTVTAVNEATQARAVARDVSTLEISRLVNLQFPTADTPIAAAALLTADVTGDGKSEIINRVEDGSWRVSVVDENGSYETTTWAQWSVNVEWQHIMTGDVDGDGKQDLVGQVADGTWWVAKSTGSRFHTSYWGAWSNQVVWSDVLLGDFNGDGRSDIAGREASTGTWWVSESTGSSFTTSSWGRWSSSVDWVNTAVGDFDGDGQSDMAGRVANDGNWWVALSQGSHFLNQHFGSWYSGAIWNEVNVADFNGDGRSDVAGQTSDGHWWVSESTGGHFQNRHWGKWSTSVDWSMISVADVNGDGKADLVGRAANDGSWWTAESTGSGFRNRFWGAIWSANEQWLAVSVDDFDGDGKSDLLGANADDWVLSLEVS